MTQNLQHHLQERIKELNLLHNTARILQDHKRNPDEICTELVSLLPPAWQYPEITAARIVFRGNEFKSDGFQVSNWKQAADFEISTGDSGCVEVYYLEEKPEAVEGPFLAEERSLINSFTEMLKYFIQHQVDDAALEESRNNLELKVKQQTEDLRKTNEELRNEIRQHLVAKQQIQEYQEQLQQLAMEVSLTEERERRTIASDLHDHLGQALAFIKTKLSALRGDVIFSGHNQTVEQILSLLNKAIQYTRTLTFELSPPVLYELGLEAALDWQAEEFEKKHNVKIKLSFKAPISRYSDEVNVLLFKSVRELLINAIKHSGANRFVLGTEKKRNGVCILVSDEGKGFNPTAAMIMTTGKMHFGLFSIRERLRHLGGKLELISSPGEGCKAVIYLPEVSNGN